MVRWSWSRWFGGWQLAGARDDPDADQGVEDEFAGGDGRPPGVQTVDLGGAAASEGLAEDEQGQADDGDQRVDAAVVLQVQVGDGQRALEGLIAALDGFLAL
ncbi:hypothetical protein [Nonomuraea sp. KM90]|uniref:hypothetical protein n=1 Tax=Nonomuraea sp. KM90 TaxID=3457428 RepID=UPI003FCCEC5E